MYLVKIPINPPLLYVSSGRFISSGPWAHKKRNIDSFVILVGLNGTVYIEQDGEQYELKPKSALLLLPHSTHFGYRESDENVSYYWCHFYCQGTYSIIDDKDLAQKKSLLDTMQYKNKNCDYILLPIYSLYDSIDRVKVLFHQLLHVANSNYYTQYGANYLLSLLLIELTQQNVSAYFQSLKNDEASSRFMEVLEWIRANISLDMSVSEVASQFSYNPDYLSRIFTQRTGMSLLKYIHYLKISKAKEMLIHSDMTIKEIAYSLGFSDEKYFMKLFKSMENITPNEFRNAYFYTHMNNH